MVVQCCVCGKVRRQDVWRHAIETFDKGNVSHSYCPHCLEVALKDAAREANTFTPAAMAV